MRKSLRTQTSPVLIVHVDGCLCVCGCARTFPTPSLKWLMPESSRFNSPQCESFGACLRMKSPSQLPCAAGKTSAEGSKMFQAEVYSHWGESCDTFPTRVWEQKNVEGLCASLGGRNRQSLCLSRLNPVAACLLLAVGLHGRLPYFYKRKKGTKCPQKSRAWSLLRKCGRPCGLCVLACVCAGVSLTEMSAQLAES